MKKIVALALAMLMTTILFGCSNQEDEEEIEWVCPMTIMVDGKLYQYERAIDGMIEIDERQMIGYISSVVSITQLPEQDGEANYEILDAPYARWSDESHEDAIIIFYNSQWHLFSPYEDYEEK